MALSLPLPWPLRRWILNRVCGYVIPRSSRIGLAWIAPDRLIMGEGSSIGHFTVCRGLELLRLGDHSQVGTFNWIVGEPSVSPGAFFAAETCRRPQLVVGDHSGITTRHYLDCTNTVVIGNFTTIAGLRSVFFSHGIDIEAGNQRSAPITIGSYCLVGTNCIVLGGSVLPDCSVLGAGSLLRDRYHETHRLYAGSPTRVVKRLSSDSAYFHRTQTVVR